MSHSAFSELSRSSPLMNRRTTSYDSYYDETDSSEVSDVFADIEIEAYRSDESYDSHESESHHESSSFEESEEMEVHSERSDEVSDIFAELYQEFTHASCSNYKDSEGYEDSEMGDEDDCSDLPAERGNY
ncbi:hypothetical protein PRIPAC_92989 [Pristionchus pacificus]|uniref:Uncharacterized protein n=1 Tax=Pristionchus pacificus TaxID=54126 RepID=A0A454Y484_PRIPA|nr:hypothetical protein PRIPAC_92989 [Pristionchus pacificus]|eukprot:PDM65650.1 hypothetical protein PRIPAC_45564 [Pristionchus pacificus]